MAVIAVFGLLLGTLLSAFGTGVYVTSAAGEPDYETLRIARIAAALGRRVAGPALMLWFGTGHTANPPTALLLVAAAVTALATYSTRPGALTHPGRPAA